VLRSSRREEFAMQCQQVMKRNVHTVAEGEDALVAARIMRDKDIGFLPVCDDAGRVVGVLTDRDLVLRVCAEDSHPAATPVATVMTRGSVACRETSSIACAERLMRRHHITRIVVLDEEQRPLGIVSLSDVAQYERLSRVGHTLRTVAERKYAPERP
jgi:CBS domain-containing protein